jgi:hypothetical protein
MVTRCQSYDPALQRQRCNNLNATNSFARFKNKNDFCPMALYVVVNTNVVGVALGKVCPKLARLSDMFKKFHYPNDPA